MYTLRQLIFLHSLGASIRLETVNERLFLLRLVHWVLFVVCMGWQVRALRVSNSPRPLHSLHSFDEVQQPVDGFNGWSEVSNSVFSCRYTLFKCCETFCDKYVQVFNYIRISRYLYL